MTADDMESDLSSPGALAATESAPVKLSPGETLGGLHVVALLGRGACGEVWKVHDDALNCDFAMKVFSPAQTLTTRERDRLCRRFVAEARCLAQFRHPNVMRVHALHADGESPFYTMDFLHPLVPPFTRRQARHILADVLSALDALHARGIVHRDVKPGNILLDDDGNAVLSDFGIAQTDGDPDDNAQIAGTPAFSALEQFTGADTTPTADIHAVGRLAVWLLDGNPPITWRWFVMRATNSSPSMRYDSAKSMRKSLFAIRVLETGFVATLAIAVFAAIIKCVTFFKPAAPLDLFEDAEITTTNVLCRHAFSCTSEMLTGRVITLKDGMTYHTKMLHGRRMSVETGYDEKLGDYTGVRIREPIFIQGKGILHADVIAFAQVHIMPGVELVTSGEYPGFTRTTVTGEPPNERLHHEAYPIRPPPDANTTNHNHTIYASYVVEKGAKLAFTDNTEYPSALIERK